MHSGSGTRISVPSSSKRHRSTPSATSENTEKLVPAPSQVAPSGLGRPGHTRTGAPARITATARSRTGPETLQQPAPRALDLLGEQPVEQRHPHGPAVVQLHGELGA